MENPQTFKCKQCDAVVVYEPKETKVFRFGVNTAIDADLPKGGVKRIYLKCPNGHENAYAVPT